MTNIEKSPTTGPRVPKRPEVVQPPLPSWGNVLTSGKDFIHVAWWLSLFPGIAILITVLAFNLFGEGLRDVLDPRV